MRKRSINFIFDHFLWYIIYALPLIVYFIGIISYGLGGFDFSTLSFSSILSSQGFTLALNNPILLSLTDIVGNAGILPLFSAEGVLVVVSWFVSSYFLHIMADVLLFIPRMALHFMDIFKKGED